MHDRTRGDTYPTITSEVSRRCSGKRWKYENEEQNDDADNHNGEDEGKDYTNDDKILETRMKQKRKQKVNQRCK